MVCDYCCAAWLGELGQAAGAPLRILNCDPDMNMIRPEPLPLINVCNQKLLDDLRSVYHLCSSDEMQQYEDFLAVGGDMSKLIIRCGDDWEGGLPGRPAYLQCMDKFGKKWRADFRFIEKLPEDLWALPAAREQAVYNRTHLSAEESKLVPRTLISSEQKAPPQSLRWRGARALTPLQLFLRDNATSDSIVEDCMNVFGVQDPDDLLVFRAAQLANFLRDKGISTSSGGKKVAVLKAYAYYLEHLKDRVVSASSDSDTTSDSSDSEEEVVIGNRRRMIRRRKIADSDSDESVGRGG